ncbi:hypothetical protein PR048_010153 [Dryococelus australis]|uniref:Uncharacterized protein n=1 Tax=Dryococelus australis TaxID=614101 RepID=A0ABQ9I1Z8_9NEOP|nr:hypothetical protein PR048_010153 [Dryococelus australis]
MAAPYQHPRSPDLNPLEFYLWGHLKILVYPIPVYDVGTLRKRFVASCEAIRNLPGIHQRIRVSMQWRVVACVLADVGHDPFVVGPPSHHQEVSGVPSCSVLGPRSHPGRTAPNLTGANDSLVLVLALFASVCPGINSSRSSGGRCLGVISADIVGEQPFEATTGWEGGRGSHFVITPLPVINRSSFRMQMSGARPAAFTYPGITPRISGDALLCRSGRAGGEIGVPLSGTLSLAAAKQFTVFLVPEGRPVHSKKRLISASLAFASRYSTRLNRTDNYPLPVSRIRSGSSRRLRSLAGLAVLSAELTRVALRSRQEQIWSRATNARAIHTSPPGLVWIPYPLLLPQLTLPWPTSSSQRTRPGNPWSCDAHSNTRYYMIPDSVKDCAKSAIVAGIRANMAPVIAFPALYGQITYQV